jgi:hypothetical protein
LVGGAGATGALGLLLAACGGDDGADRTTGAQAATTGAASTTSRAAAKTDLQIVNDALTLEYLEADFYDQVVASDLLGTAPSPRWPSASARPSSSPSTPCWRRSSTSAGPRRAAGDHV